ncbi:MAG: zinc-binding dehydrogenase, partial [Stackebrandtia sp.]
VRHRLAGRQITVGVDSVGGKSGRASFDLLGAGGRYILLGWSGTNELTHLDGKDIVDRSLQVTSVLGPRMTARPGGIRSLETEALQRLAAGRLIPLIQSFPLEQAGRAHRDLETRATIGKVVLAP